MARRLSEIFIIHFQTLEFYPPVCNLLDYLVKHQENTIIVATTENRKQQQLSTYANPSERLIIRRAKAISPNSLFRLFYYLFFYLNCLRLLLKYQPKSILYFDTLSSWPALMYKTLKGGKVKLLAHYHEYVSPAEYASNMRLVKMMHRLERKMYVNSYKWISQTNEVRLQKMIADNALENVNPTIFHTMPNYPSRDWAVCKTQKPDKRKKRLVYVGALGYDTTYLQELADWVAHHKDEVTLDIYTFNIDKKAEQFLLSIQEDCIQLHAGVNYDELPCLLKAYDIGLIIYKPVSANWIYNAPNKLFEYIACGLDVWFSKTMTYALSFVRVKTFPKILAVDFESLDQFNYKDAFNREDLAFEEPRYFYEGVYGDIVTALNE